VGTSTPVSGAQLTVAGSALAVTGQNLDHSANSIRIGQEGSGAAQIRCYGPNTSTNGSLTFKMSRSDGANSQDVVIDGSGRLGIGTSSVSRSLHVAQANSTAYSSSDFEQDYQILRLNNTTNDGSVGLEFQVGTNGQASITANEVTDGNTDICFGTRGSGARTEKVRITAGGLVGIGTSPSYKLHVISNNTVSADNTIAMSYGRAANPTDALHKITWGSDDLRIEADTANTIASNITFTNDGTERARIDSSGRLLVGTSTASGYSSSRVIITGAGTDSTGAGNLVLQIGQANGSVTADEQIGTITFGDTSGYSYATIVASADLAAGSDSPGRLSFSTTADGASSPTERMRITNSGYFKASTAGTYYGASGAYHEMRSSGNDWIAVLSNTHASQPYGLVINYNAAPNNTSSEFLYCSDTNVRAVIRSNGGFANYQANNVNLSDINSKKDISPAAGTWDCIKEWEIVNYRYKDQPDDADLNLGVIAQQVAESCPEVITVFQEAKEATEDAPAREERLGVKEQQMYWMAIKALQEAQVRIEALEAEVAALKAQ
jgi:hypothetical protein